MQLTLVDSLRCPAHDDESSLVLSVEEWAGPRVAEGILGCPVCHARYRIHHGSVDFAPGAHSVRHDAVAVDPVRLAAQLSLTEPGGIILLTGRYAAALDALGQYVESIFVLVDAAETSSATAVNIHVADRLPFVDRALRGAAIDHPRSSPAFVAEVGRCLQAQGRMVNPAASLVPPTVQLLARDEFEWVGEVVDSGEPAPVRLRRADRAP